MIKLNSVQLLKWINNVKMLGENIVPLYVHIFGSVDKTFSNLLANVIQYSYHNIMASNFCGSKFSYKTLNPKKLNFRIKFCELHSISFT